MPVTVVVGGQYGSEGKGKMVSHLAQTSQGAISVVRSGGSNAGHTAQGGGKTYRLRQLPSGVVADHCSLYMGAGMLIDLPVLLREIEETGVEPWRLRIDRNAALIESADSAYEAQAGLRNRIGSTLSGTGSATARKVLREAGLPLASEIEQLAPYITNVSRELNRAIDRGEHVIVEGSQGFGLSLHHADSYPYVTSRDTTASAFLSEVGLSPRLVSDIVMVVRSYPIRVAGASGPLYREITWEDIARRAGYPSVPAEYTTVTGMLRRVGEFDWDLVERAVEINRPTALAVHGLDYLDYSDFGATEWSELGTRTKRFVQELESRLYVPVHFLFTGPDGHHLIDLREEASLGAAQTVSAAAVW
jgi:adenylosuccinate synthase